MLFDSLWNEYQNQVLYDITYIDQTTSSQKISLFDEKIEDEVEDKVSVIKEIKLEIGQNQPNPFEYMTDIKYYLSDLAWAQLTIVDIKGREVAVLLDEYTKAGWHEMTINGSGLTVGAYFVVLQSNGRIIMKMIHRE